jgi:hypothetical protein
MKPAQSKCKTNKLHPNASLSCSLSLTLVALSRSHLSLCVYALARVVRVVGYMSKRKRNKTEWGV